MESLRNNTCGNLRATDIGQTTKLCGWVNSRRDHGGVIFLDLRDHTGLVQIVCEPAHTQAFGVGELLRPEHVIQVHGKVCRRPEDSANPDLLTGEIEVLAEQIEHLNAAITPPFQPDDPEVTEDTRLEHRVMHLRSSAMQHNLRVRHKIGQAVHQALDTRGFIEVETPILTKSTPEGARDFLVPARNLPGHFYALPQSPQLFKQVLIAGGVDRYYQFARCFRDEDLRSSRQPEFTQIDIEMAFVTEQDVMEIATTVVRDAFKVAGLPNLGEIPTISYADAMRTYGCDAPDLSVDMQLLDIADEVKDCGFKVFAAPASTVGNRVAALRVAGGSKLSRKQINDLTDFVRKLGASGLAYLKVDEPNKGIEGATSPIAKHLGDDVVNKIVSKCRADKGDIIFFGAGPTHVVNAYLAPLRVRLGHGMNLVKKGFWPVWVTDFPLFERDPDTGVLLCPHHPFTAPTIPDLPHLLNGAEPTDLHSRAYDLVINGEELGGGSIRIHQEQVQLRTLALLGMDEATAREKFGFLLNTLAQGAPPHGGIAFGFDRMVAMALGADSIRSVIAFPKTQSGHCPFTAAPQPVGTLQLAELGLDLQQGNQGNVT